MEESIGKREGGREPKTGHSSRQESERHQWKRYLKILRREGRRRGERERKNKEKR